MADVEIGDDWGVPYQAPITDAFLGDGWETQTVANPGTTPDNSDLPNPPLNIGVVGLDSAVQLDWSDDLSGGQINETDIYIEDGFTDLFSDYFGLGLAVQVPFGTNTATIAVPNDVTYRFAFITSNSAGDSIIAYSPTVTPTATANTGDPTTLTGGDTGSGSGDPGTGGTGTGGADTTTSDQPTRLIFTPEPAPYPFSVPTATPNRLRARPIPQTSIGRGVRIGAYMVQWAYLIDDAGNDFVDLVPMLDGGLGIMDMDLGGADALENMVQNPGRSGSLDLTSLTQSRGIQIDLVAIDGYDDSGTLQTPAFWADAAIAWTRPFRRPRLCFQLYGQAPRQIFLSGRSATNHPPGVDEMRDAQLVTLQFKSADGLIYETAAQDNDLGLNDGREQLNVLMSGGAGSGGLGFPLSFPLAFGDYTNQNGTVIPYRGSVPFAPEIRIAGGCENPQLVMEGYDYRQGVFVQRGNLEFAGAGGLTVPPDQELRVNCQDGTAYVASVVGDEADDHHGQIVLTNVSKYLSQFSWFELQPGSADPAYSRNRLKFNATSAGGPARVYWWNAF